MPEILFEDKAIAVCVKPAGVPAQSDPTGDPSLLELLEQRWKAAGAPGRAYPVHRLDRGTGGVMVVAKTAAAAAKLSAAVQCRNLKKEYIAIVQGAPEAESGEMEDLLFWDRGKRKSYVVKRQRAGVKQAKLLYTLLAEKQGHSLVRVQLLTGRTHQIRVQFASRRMPLVGDGKYGGRDNCAMALWAWGLMFPHPTDGRTMEFFSLPPSVAPWTEFAQEIEQMSH